MTRDIPKGWANRIGPPATSVFSEFSALALEHKAINLGQGFPNFEGPPQMLEAALSAMRSGSHNQYAVSLGIEPLRNAVAKHARRFYDMPVNPQTMVVITSGANEAIFDAMFAFVDPGDEVIVFEPCYDTYRATIEWAGGIAKSVTLRRPDATHDGWWFDPSELARAFTAKTKVVLLNTPHNPTGKVFTFDELTLIAELCVKHDVIAVSDEVYEHLVFHPAKHYRIANFTGMAERTLTVSSAGKTFSYTGWKVGWAIGAPRLRNAIQQVHQFNTFCCPAPLQMAAAVGLELPDTYFTEFADAYLKRRNLLVEALRKAELSPIVPEGTYFIMADIGSYGFNDDRAFCTWLVEKGGVASIPPASFYSDETRSQAATLARFAFCKTDDELEAAAARLLTAPYLRKKERAASPG